MANTPPPLPPPEGEPPKENYPWSPRPREDRPSGQTPEGPPPLPEEGGSPPPPPPPAGGQGQGYPPPPPQYGAGGGGQQPPYGGPAQWPGGQPPPHHPQQYPGAPGGGEMGFTVETWPPWEDPSQPFFQRLWETFRSSCFEPTEFFERLSPEGQPAWGYAIIGGFVGGLTNFVISMLFALIGIGGGMMAGQGGGGGAGGFGATGTGALDAAIQATFYLATPVFVLIGILIYGLIYHGVLYMLGGTNAPLMATFRVLSYSNGSAAPWSVIPCVGGIATFAFSLILSIIGLQKMHQCDTWKAVVAVLTPMVVCCGLAGLLIFGVFGAAFFGAAAGGGGGF